MTANPSPASPTDATNIAAVAEPVPQTSRDGAADTPAGAGVGADADAGATGILPASHWIAQERDVRGKTSLRFDPRILCINSKAIGRRSLTRT